MSRITKTLVGEKARQAILRGVNAIYGPAKLTLGPGSGSVLAYRTFNRGPRIFNDGNATAQIIEVKDEHERLVADAFKEAAEQTNKKAGDGTTTTMVIAAKLINGTLSKLSESSKSYVDAASLNVNDTCKQLLELSKKVQDEVKMCGKKIDTLEDLEKIAIVSMSDERIGKIVAQVVWETGVDGFVDVVEGYKGEIETEIIRGARFAAKPASKAFVNNPSKFEMVMEDCAVLLTDQKFDNDRDARELFSKIVPKNKKLIVLSPEFGETVLTSMFQTMMVPNKEGVLVATGFQLWPVKVPSLRTEQFEDLAVYFDANFISKASGKKLSNVEETDLGFLEKLVVKDTENREDAIALGGRGVIEEKHKIADKEYAVTSKVAERIKTLKSQIEEERTDSHKKILERRIASLASAVGIIRVGASTSAEALPLKLKVEDTQYACRSALEEGYVKGGGLCLREIADGIENPLLSAALKEPYNQIQENNGSPLQIGEDIIDPVKVVRLAVENAVSVAANLLTVKVIVAEEDDLDPAQGYLAIAKEVHRGVSNWMRYQGLMTAAQLEMDQDTDQRNEEIIAADNG